MIRAQKQKESEDMQKIQEDQIRKQWEKKFLNMFLLSI